MLVWYNNPHHKVLNIDGIPWPPKTLLPFILPNESLKLHLSAETLPTLPPHPNASTARAVESLLTVSPAVY